MISFSPTLGKIDTLYQANFRMPDSDWNMEEKGFALVEANPALEDTDVKVYPNPFDRSIRLLLIEEVTTSTSYEVFSIHGQRLLHGDLTAERIQEILLPELAAGTYLLRLSGGEKVFSVKVVKY